MAKRSTPKRGPNVSKNIALIHRSEIAHAEPYIRKSVIADRINMWTSDYEGALEDLRKKDADAKPLEVWKHPPIIVIKLTKPKETKFRDRDSGKAAMRTVSYMVADGEHRLHVAERLGMESILCEIYPETNGADYMAMQYRANSEGPAQFTREERDTAIRYMVKECRQTQEAVSVIVKLTPTQVSRIVQGKSGRTAAEVSAARKKGAAKRNKKKRGGYDAGDFFANCRIMAKEAVSKQKQLKDYLENESTKPWTHAADLIAALERVKPGKSKD